MTHTKTPWVIFNGRDIHGVHDTDHARLHIADCAPDGYEERFTDIDVPTANANAKHIVHCVNLHDELVDALQDAADSYLSAIAINDVQALDEAYECSTVKGWLSLINKAKGESNDR